MINKTASVDLKLVKLVNCYLHFLKLQHNIVNELITLTATSMTIISTLK